jgi:hypothetical protein
MTRCCIDIIAAVGLDDDDSYLYVSVMDLVFSHGYFLLATYRNQMPC